VDEDVVDEAVEELAEELGEDVTVSHTAIPK